MADNNTQTKLLKLDLGCGTNKIQPHNEWTGVDSIAFPGVDIVEHLAEKVYSKPNKNGTLNYTYKSWVWEDNSVDEVHCSHFVEHLDAEERIHFINELYRIMKPNAKATIIVPHWCSARAYGDLSHKFPPVSEFWFYYLSADWRKTQAPHTDAASGATGHLVYKNVNFSASWGYALHNSLNSRNQEFQNFALGNYKEAAQDIVSTLIKM